MTKLSRPVRREVSSVHHGALMVTLAPEGVYFRQKGRRTSYLLPYGVGYQEAARRFGLQQRAERERARKEKRKSLIHSS